MNRRAFIGLVGGAAAWPLSASAQQAGRKIVTIGILAIEPWPPRGPAGRAPRADSCQHRVIRKPSAGLWSTRSAQVVRDLFAGLARGFPSRRGQSAMGF